MFNYQTINELVGRCTRLAQRATMRVQSRILRLGVIGKEVRQWSFGRLPLGFTVPLVVITVIYFIVLYPVLVYQFVPWLLARPALWAHNFFEFGAVSEMGTVGWWAARIYHHLLHIAAALLTLAVAIAGVVVGHNLASFCYHRWRILIHRLQRPVSRPTVELRNITSASNGTTALRESNPLARFARIGIILAGGGAKGAYQAGAMKAIYEFIEDCGGTQQGKDDCGYFYRVVERALLACRYGQQL